MYIYITVLTFGTTTQQDLKEKRGRRRRWRKGKEEIFGNTITSHHFDRVWHLHDKPRHDGERGRRRRNKKVWTFVRQKSRWMKWWRPSPLSYSRMTYYHLCSFYLGKKNRQEKQSKSCAITANVYLYLTSFHSLVNKWQNVAMGGSSMIFLSWFFSETK